MGDIMNTSTSNIIIVVDWIRSILTHIYKQTSMILIINFTSLLYGKQERDDIVHNMLCTVIHDETINHNNDWDETEKLVLELAKSIGIKDDLISSALVITKRRWDFHQNQ